MASENFKEWKTSRNEKQTDSAETSLRAATSSPQPFVAKLLAIPDAVGPLSPALADAIFPFLNKFPDACLAYLFLSPRFTPTPKRLRANEQSPTNRRQSDVDSDNVD
jgi:hypothetical protein